MFEGHTSTKLDVVGDEGDVVLNFETGMSRLLENEISSSFGEDLGLDVGSGSVDGYVGEALVARREAVSFRERERRGTEDEPDDHVEFGDHGVQSLEHGDVGSCRTKRKDETELGKAKEGKEGEGSPAISTTSLTKFP